MCLKVLGRKLLILHYILRRDENENDLRLKQFINYLCLTDVSGLWV